MKGFFGWPLTGDVSTLSGGIWTTELPLGNLKTDLISTVAESVDNGLTSTIIKIDQGSAKEVSVIALCGHNIRSADLWRVRMDSTAAMSSPTFNSDWVECWGPQWDASVLPSGHPNAATRYLTDAQINMQNPLRNIVLVIPKVTERYIEIELDLTNNVDAKARIGRLVVAPRYEPTYNFAVGAEFGFNDEMLVGKAQSGTRYYDKKKKGRSLSLLYQNLPDREAYSVMRDMLEEMGQSGQIYFVQNQNDVTSLQRRSMLCNFRAVSSVQYAAAGYSSVPVNLDEVI